MSKKVIIGIIATFMVLISIIIFVNKRNNNTELSTISSSELQNGDTILFEGNDGAKYKAVYDADSFVYEIFDENGSLVCVSPDKSSFENHFEIPENINNLNENIE